MNIADDNTQLELLQQVMREQLAVTLARAGSTTTELPLFLMAAPIDPSGQVTIVPDASDFDAHGFQGIGKTIDQAWHEWLAENAARRQGRSIRERLQAGGQLDEIRELGRNQRRPIEEALKSSDDANELVSLISSPTRREGRWCFAIVRVPRGLMGTDPGFDLFSAQDTLSFNAKSLLDGIIAGFFDDLIAALSDNDPTRFPKHLSTLRFRSPDERIRDAAKGLLNMVSYVGITGSTHRARATESVFYVFNAISAQPYEGRPPRGVIIVAPDDDPQVETIARFAQPIPLSSQSRHVRTARKYLEMATSGIALLSNSLVITGLGRVKIDDRSQLETILFEVTFKDRFVWEVSSTKPMLRVAYGDPLLPRERLTLDEAYAEVLRVFPSIEEDLVQRLGRLFLAALEQDHGALIVVTNDAASEARRLAERGSATLIDPMLVLPEHILSLSAIDGALLLSPDGTCHAVGVILDGQSDVPGEPGRGARYNSALRYSVGRIVAGAPTLACVVCVQRLIMNAENAGT